MKKRLNLIILLAIIIVAALLRFYKLTSSPPSLNWDEVSHGYNAYSILKTGKDEWGKTIPVIFRAYGDNKLPSYIYLTALSICTFGLNEFSVRFISALSGILSVIFTYLFVNALLRNIKLPFKVKHLAFLSSLLVAIEPWSLFLSRGAFEANLALLFEIIAVYLFIKGIKRNACNLIPSSIFFGLTVWTYNSYRVFTPIILGILLIFYRKEIRETLKSNFRVKIGSIIILTLLFIPMFYQLVRPIGQARYGKVGIIDSGTVGQIIEARNKSTLPQIVKRIIYNRPIYFVKGFVGNWISHYSADFLFTKGGSNYQFNVPGYGLIYLINAPFLVIGVFYLLIKRNREGFLILIFFYLGSVASALTREAPQTLRAIPMLPSPMILSAVGVFVTLGWLKKLKIGNILTMAVIVIYILLLCFSLKNYLSVYFGSYRVDYSWSWQYGYRQVANYIKGNYDKYDNIILTKKYGEPHEFLLFYLKWSPKYYQSDPNLIRFYQSEWYWVDRFDKFYFVNDWDIPTEEWQDIKLESGGKVDCSKKESSCLLITSPGNYPKGWSKLETINFLDGKPALEILNNK